MNKPETIPDPADKTAPATTSSKRKTPDPKIKVSAKPSANLQRCNDAADIAFQLIEHLAKKGHPVDREHYDAVYDVTQITDGEISADREHAFWSSYSAIVNTLKAEEEDADPEGIYFTALYEMQKTQQLSPAANSHRRELANRSRVLVWGATGLLLVLIGVLAFGNILNNMVGSIDQLRAEHQAIQIGNVDDTRLAAYGLVCGPNAPENSVHVCQFNLTLIESELRSAAQLIDYWIWWADAADSTKAKTYAKQTFIFLENYIFPLLAGALGACVSLLRQIFAQLSEKKLHLRLFQSLELRIAVGTIAGIVVGWVSTPDVSSGISLTPLALAFAAGYGVEIIYNMLDRIVAAFSGKELKT
jgi:hypothetical protein